MKRAAPFALEALTARKRPRPAPPLEDSRAPAPRCAPRCIDGAGAPRLPSGWNPSLRAIKPQLTRALASPSPRRHAASSAFLLPHRDSLERSLGARWPEPVSPRDPVVAIAGALVLVKPRGDGESTAPPHRNTEQRTPRRADSVSPPLPRNPSEQRQSTTEQRTPRRADCVSPPPPVSPWWPKAPSFPPPSSFLTVTGHCAMLLSLVTVKPRNDERVVKPRHTTESSRPQRRHSLAPPQATEGAAPLHSMAAVPLPNLVFGDLAEVETLRAGRGIYEVVFELNAQTSLRHAEEVDNITRPGLRGFRLMNPELLHCKKRTKMELEKAYRRMRDQCLAQCDQEISTLDMQIAFVKQMIAVPNVMLPHVGPPAEQRNQGVQRSMQLPAVYMPYQSYVIGPGAIPYQPPFPDISDRVASLFRDRFAQKAWWELNLVFLETRKQAAEEKKSVLGEEA